MIEEAKREDNEKAAEGLRTAGEGFAQAWQCPRFTGEPCPDVAPDEVQHVLVRIERLTGVTGLRTCPRHESEVPAVAVACAAREWRSHGSLEQRYGPPTLALMQSIECIDGALAARDRAERKAREKRKPHGGHD